MYTFLKHWFKIFSRIFSATVVLVFVLANILNPDLVSFNSVRASVYGLGVTFSSSDGATWSGTVYNDVGSGYQGGQQVTSLFRAFHCNSSSAGACADDLGLGGDFDRVLDSQSYTLNVPAQGSSSQISFMIPSVSCGRVQVDLGAAGGILGGQVFDTGRSCGSVGAPAPAPAPQYGPLNVAASSSCGSTGNMQISSSWSNIGAASYQATMQISSSTVASTCVGAATSYNFGNYPIRNDANYIVSVFAYSGANCSGNTVMNGNFGVDRPSCAAPAPAPAPACPTSGAGTIYNTTVNTTTYDICTDNLGGRNQNGTLCSYGATTFGCVSSINSACQSGMVYNCPTQSVNQAYCTISPSSSNINPGSYVNWTGNYYSGTGSNTYATEYYWSYGDGTAESRGSNNQTSHYYNNSGTYPVNLRVLDSRSNYVNCPATVYVSSTSNQCRSISCPSAPSGCYYSGRNTRTCDPDVSLSCGTLVCNDNNPPSCFITPQSQSGSAPFSANFTGNLLSSGSGGVTYSWDLNDDSIFGDATGFSASATFNRSSTVRLNVRDVNNQSNTCYAVVSILNIAQGQPFCTLNVSSNPINISSSVTLTANYNSNGSTGSAQSYNFSFGDGQNSSGSGNSTTHTYNSAGSFGPSVRITDSRGNQVSCSSSLTVNSPQGTVQLATAGGQVVAPAVAPAVAPRVVQVAGIEARELPRSGLPTLFWAVAAFLPVGFRLRRFGGSVKGDSANVNYLWEEKKFRGLDSK